MFTLQYKWRRNVRSLALALASWVMSLTPSLAFIGLLAVHHSHPFPTFTQHPFHLPFFLAGCGVLDVDSIIIIYLLIKVYKIHKSNKTSKTEQDAGQQGSLGL